MRLIDAVNFWDSCFSVPLDNDAKQKVTNKVATVKNPNEGDVVAALLKQRSFSQVEVYLITLAVKRFTKGGYDSAFFKTYVYKICSNHTCGPMRRNTILNIADQLICRYHLSNNVRWVA